MSNDTVIKTFLGIAGAPGALAGLQLPPGLQAAVGGPHHQAVVQAGPGPGPHPGMVMAAPQPQVSDKSFAPKLGSN